MAATVSQDRLARSTQDPIARTALYGLLGFSAGLPFYMFSTVLALRLQAHGVALAVIGFFAWVQLLPTLKFLWAPLLDRYDMPGFARFWGKRRGWIMLAQLGIFTSLVTMATTAADDDLAVTALCAVLLAFWTTTLEIASDAWRIELAPTQAEQGPIVAANLWGYRSAMVAAGSGALILADLPGWGWTGAYLVIALAAFLPFPLLVATPPEEPGGGGRWVALATGLVASAAILLAVAGAAALLGWGVLQAATAAGLNGASNVTPYVLILCLLPFVLLAAALPRLRALPPEAWARRSVAVGPYVAFFRRYGFAVLMLLAFVSLYRMGDVLALNLSKPMIRELGYSLTQIGRADSIVALAGAVLGVGVGGWIAARWPIGRALAAGAVVAAIGNFGFVWLGLGLGLGLVPPGEAALYLTTGIDQFGNGLAGAVFVVYLSLLVSPRFAGAQYAFLSGFAFLLPRLLAGAGGSIVVALDAQGLDGFALFFFASGVLSLAAILFLPALSRLRPGEEE